MLDFNQIKARTSELLTEAGRKFKQYTPETFSKEKKFVNALVISLVLMTMADKKAETEEIEASIDLINEIDEINELEMNQEAIELYTMHLETLEKALESNVKWTLAIANLLSEVGKVKPYPEYPPMIENLMDCIMESDGNTDPLEIAMKDKIIAALN